MDLQNDLHALEGGGDGGHGDSGEEAGGGDLGDGEGAIGRSNGGDGSDEVFAEVITPEGDGDYFFFAQIVSKEMMNWEAKDGGSGVTNRGMIRNTNVHIGVTPTNGALTPAYKPRRKPSRAILLRTTSIAEE